MTEHATERDGAVAGESNSRLKLTSARDARTAAERAVAAAREAIAIQDRAAALARARERVASLDELEAELTDQERTAGQVIAPKELQQLAALDKAVVEARAVVSAGAVRVEISSRDGTPVRVGGAQASNGTREITSATLIEVGEHAAIRVIPSGVGSAAAQLAAAQDALATALTRHGVASYADASARSDAGKAAGQAAAALRRQIDTLCIAAPIIGLAAGPAPLRALVSSAAQSEAGEGGSVDLAGAEAELTRCSEAERAASGRHDAAVIKLRAVEDAARTLGIALAGASDRRMVLIERIAGLEAKIESEGAKGLASQVDAAREEEAAAEQAVSRLTAEADTLELLRTTLRDAHEAASRTFLGPVTKRAVQHVRRVLPDCDVTFSEELGLTSIMRGGVCEGCGDLSRGTQEQLAVLTRLAFADMLLDKGEPVSLILDDPLVYSDDERLEIMTDILTSAAERMQVILLTCRERAFRHIGGTRVTI